MIVLVPGAIGVLSALFSAERVRRLAALPVRRVWLVWTAFAVQVAVLEALAGVLPVVAGEVIHLGTYALLVLFLVFNRHLPGAVVIAAGTACNLAAIAANGGTMPASARAWALAGRPPTVEGEFSNSATLSDPRLQFLGDIFAVPAGWPLANVFSVGDVLVVVGATYLAHRWCSRPLDGASTDIGVSADRPGVDAPAPTACVVEAGADGETRTLTDEDLNLAPLPVGLRRPDGTQDTVAPSPTPVAPPAAWPAPVAVRLALGGAANAATGGGHAVVIDIAVPDGGATPGTSVTIRTTAPAPMGSSSPESAFVTEVTLHLGPIDIASPPPAALTPTVRRFAAPSGVLGSRAGAPGGPMLTVLPGSGAIATSGADVLPPPAPAASAAARSGTSMSV